MREKGNVDVLPFPQNVTLTGKKYFCTENRNKSLLLQEISNFLWFLSLYSREAIRVAKIFQNIIFLRIVVISLLKLYSLVSHKGSRCSRKEI